jgi:SAM-dependent methyltransferase
MHNTTEHIDKQRSYTDLYFQSGPRSHTVTNDPLVRYVTDWRINAAIDHLEACAGELDRNVAFLVLCAAEAREASVLCDRGFTNVTVSDISSVALEIALKRDPRLRGQVLSAECLELANESFDVVFVQDGLHHLRSPIQGFTEMMRVARVAAIFLEPHDSWIGRMLGTKWEHNGDAVNYVFRWSKKLVGDVASSYLGDGQFKNASFPFWHHNPILARLGTMLGGGRGAIALLRGLKFSLNSALSRQGNQFCGMVVKKSQQLRGRTVRQRSLDS